MLTTGRSYIKVYNALIPKGKPKEVHIVSVLGLNPGWIQ